MAIYRNSAQAHPIDAHRIESLGMFYTSLADGKEGVNAFLNKRQPVFNSKVSDPPFFSVVVRSAAPFRKEADFCISKVTSCVPLRTSLSLSVPREPWEAIYAGNSPNLRELRLQLLPNSLEARICSFECTFCLTCVEEMLDNVCPNCGGGFTPRPIRPARRWRGENCLTAVPASTKVVSKPVDRASHKAFAASIKTIPPDRR
jgi:uncharacterized protein